MVMVSVRPFALSRLPWVPHVLSLQRVAQKLIQALLYLSSPGCHCLPCPRTSSHCLREQPAPDSLLKQSADILVKTNLILFLFWDRWKEIDAFVSNQKRKERERQYTSFLFDSHFFGTKAAGCHSSRDLTAFREVGARLASRKGSFDGQSTVLFSL